MALAALFLYYFQTFQLCTSNRISSKSMSRVFNTLFQTKDINIFVLHGVFFTKYVQPKASFSDGKKTAVKSETDFSREPIKV